MVSKARGSALAAALLAAAILAAPASAEHKFEPSTNNYHALGESFEFGSFLPQPPPQRVNSDLAFWGRLAFEGSYDGFRVINISAPGNPKEVADVSCNGNQGDVIVWEDILIRAVDRPQILPGDDLANACEGTDAPSGTTGFEGLQIFQADDWRSVTADDLIAAVPIDCGSHTATLAPDAENGRLIVYSSAAFSSAFAGPTPYGTACTSPHDKIVATEIPLDDPASAAVVNNDIPASERGCHDVFAAVGADRMVGACRPMVVVWDISDPANPTVQLETTAPDPTIAGWHSAALTWDGELLVMGWEPGGGSRPACQATGTPLDPPIAGNAVQTDEMKSIFFFDADDGSLVGMWTLPRPQSSEENCTIHNYNVVPLRGGRYVLVQGSYQSGGSVVDFTDPTDAHELGFADPPPLVPTQLGGDWSTYWYNGFIYETDINVGLRVWNFSGRNTAGALRLDHLNPQTSELVIE